MFYIGLASVVSMINRKFLSILLIDYVWQTSIIIEKITPDSLVSYFSNFETLLQENAVRKFKGL